MRSKVVPKEGVPELQSDGCVTYEKDLPYPYVHYPSQYGGTFIGFQKHQDGPVFHCSCQQQGLEVYLLNEGTAYLRGIPKAVRMAIGQDFFDQLWFEDNLCHICNQVCPTYGCGKTTLYATKFYSIYGFYIDALQYEYGIGKMGEIYDGKLLPEDIVLYLITDRFDDHRIDEISRKDLSRYCEDIIRSRMGYFGVGKKWTTEIKLLELIRKVYPRYTVNHQYELDHLKADIYIEELELVIEYQGEQHYLPFSHLGGEEGLKKRQAKDHEKVELCDYYNLGLIYFTYKDKLTDELIKERITTYLTERNK